MPWVEAINKEAKSYERFIKRISVVASGCWEMNNWHDRDGYAHFHKSKDQSKAQPSMINKKNKKR